MTDDVWQLAERCWATDPRSRPTSDAVCDAIRSMRNSRTSSHQTSPEPKGGEAGPGHQCSDNEYVGHLADSTIPACSSSSSVCTTRPALLDAALPDPDTITSANLNCAANRSLSNLPCHSRPAFQEATHDNPKTSARSSTDDLASELSSTSSSACGIKPAPQDTMPSHLSTNTGPASDVSTYTSSFNPTAAHDAQPTPQDTIPSNMGPQGRESFAAVQTQQLRGPPIVPNLAVEPTAKRKKT